MLYTPLLLLLIISSICNVYGNENETSDESGKIPYLRESVLTILDHLNEAPPTKVYYYRDATVISAHKKGDISEIVLDVNVECTHDYPGLLCDDGVRTCSGYVRQTSSTVSEVLGPVICVPKIKSVETQAAATLETEINTSNPQDNTPREAQPVALSNEEVSSEQTGEHFVAFRRQLSPCLGCLLELDPHATGVDDIIRLGINHIESEQRNKHKAVKIIKLQQQVVAGVKYIALLEIASTDCSKDDSKPRDLCKINENSIRTCEIVYFQKPWISKTKHIIKNNCTNSQEFVESDNNDQKSNDIDNEIETNDDHHRHQQPKNKKKNFFETPNFDQIAETGHIYDDVISPSRLADLESQILFGESIQTDPSRQYLINSFEQNIKPTVQSELVPGTFSSAAAIEAVDDRPSNSVNTENVAIMEPSQLPPEETSQQEFSTLQMEEYTPSRISFNLESTVPFQFSSYDGSATFYSSPSAFPMNYEPETNNNEEMVSITGNLGNIRIRDKRAIKQLEKISPEEKSIVRDLADYAAKFLDNIDDDDQKRIVLQILGAKKLVTAGDGTFYHLILRLGISECLENAPLNPQENCREKLLENYTKICKVQVFVDEDFSSTKVTKSQCQNIKKDKNDSNRTNYSRFKRNAQNRKRRGLAGGITKQSPTDPKFLDLAYNSLGQLDSEGNNNKLKIRRIISVTSQVVSGASYNIKAEVIESDCSKDDSKHPKECGEKDGAKPKICKFRILDQSWLPDGVKTNITCEEETSSRRKRSPQGRRRLIGGPMEQSPTDPKYLNLVYDGLIQLDADSDGENKLKVDEIISVKTQVVEGILYRITARIVESDCSKNDERHPMLCNVKEDAEPRLCNIKVWDRPWLPNGRQITFKCDNSDKEYSYTTSSITKKKRSIPGGVSEQSTTDPKYLDLAYSGLAHLDAQGNNNKLKISKILKVKSQVVSGIKYEIKAEIVESDCKNDDPKHPKDCGVKDEAQPQICNFIIWDRPWLKDGRETNITCENEAKQFSFRNKRGAKGAPVEQSKSDPKYLDFAYESLSRLDSESNDNNKLKVEEIISVTRQTVAGTLYKINAKIVESDCSKTDSKQAKDCGVKSGAESRNCEIKIWEKIGAANDKETTIKCDNDAKEFKYRNKRSLPGGVTEQSTTDPKYLDLTYSGLAHLDSQGNNNKLKVSKILEVKSQVVAGTKYEIKAEIVESDCKNDDPKHPKDCGKRDGAQPQICNFIIWDRPWLPNGRETNVTCENDAKEYSFRSKRGAKGAPVEQSKSDPKYLDFAYESLSRLDSESNDNNKLKVEEIILVTRQTVAGTLYKINAKIVESDCSKTDSKHAKDCGVKSGAESRNCEIKIWEKVGAANDKETTIKCDNDAKEFKYRNKRSIPGGVSEQSTTDPKYLDLAYSGLAHLDAQGNNNKLKISKILNVKSQVVAGTKYEIKAEIVESDCKNDDPKHPKDCGKRDGAQPQICNFVIWDRPWLPNGRETNVTCENDAKEYSFRSKRSLPGGVSEQSTTDPKYLDLAYSGLAHLDAQGNNNKLKISKILNVKSQVVSGMKYEIKAEIVESDCKNDDPKHPKDCGVKDEAQPQICNFIIWDRPWLPNGRETNVTCENDAKEYSFRSKRGAKGAPVEQSKSDPKYLDFAYESLSRLDSESNDNNKLKVEEILSVTRQTVAGTLYKINAKVVESDCSKTDSKQAKDCGVKSGAESRNCEIKIWEKVGAANDKETTIKCDNDAKEFKYRNKRSIPGGVTEQSTTDPKYLDLTYSGLAHLDSQGNNNKLKVSKILEVKSQVVAGTKYEIKAEIVESDCKNDDPKHPKDCGKRDGAQPQICNFIIWDRPWLPNGRETNVTCENDAKEYSFRSKRSLPGGVSEQSTTDPKYLDLAYSGLAHLDAQGNNNKLKISKILNVKSQVVSGMKYEIKAEIVESDCKNDDPKHPKDCGVKDEAQPQICNFIIWDRPWLPNGRETNVTCENDAREYSFRSKRSLPGGVSEQSTTDPKYLDLTYAGLAHLDSQGNNNKLKVSKILKVKSQVVSGMKYEIKAEIVESDCKNDDPKHPKDCGVKDNAEPQICNFIIWDRPWLPNGKETNITCENEAKEFSFRSKRDLLHGRRRLIGGPIEQSPSDPKYLNLVYDGLIHLDATSDVENKLKVDEIISVKSQVVEGTLYRITARVIESDCSKNDERHPMLCGVKEDAKPRLCNIKVWDRPWLDNGRETKITCDNSDKEFLFKSKRSIDRSRSKRQSIELDEETSSYLFKKFQKKHNRQYANDVEKKYRYEVFRENLKTIRELNKNEQGTAVYGATKFADWTKEEFSKLLGYRSDLRVENDMPLKEAVIPDVELPPEVDWRKKGAVTKVKDQASCGSCWAFSTTGNIEGQYAIKHNNLLEFSEQELLDCDDSDQGCNGGLMDNAYRAIEKLGGLETEQDYPYDAEDEKCHFNKTLARVQVVNAVNISHNETDMAKWLVANGPIAIAINANAMQFYVGGVSHPLKFLCNPNNLDHGVLIVGYGTHYYPLFNRKLPYWIVKNSWGTSWGEQGYYRVYRGDGTCGLNQTPSSAIVA